jgi:hypothetical protein
MLNPVSGPRETREPAGRNQSSRSRTSTRSLTRSTSRPPKMPKIAPPQTLRPVEVGEGK